jgi:hypothetical protein
MNISSSYPSITTVPFPAEDKLRAVIGDSYHLTSSGCLWAQRTCSRLSWAWRLASDGFGSSSGLMRHARQRRPSLQAPFEEMPCP